MSQAGTRSSLSSAKATALLVPDSTFLIVALWIAAFLIISTAIAFAQSRAEKNPAPRVAALPVGSAVEAAPARFDRATLPSIDSIDAQTDISVFLGGDVPAALQLAALRRAWIRDPAIRDFRGLLENDWDFTEANRIPGFGELGPEVDVERMVARIFGEPVRIAVADSTSRPRRRP